MTDFQSLPVPLTSSRRAELSAELAKQVASIADIEEAKKVMAANYAEQLISGKAAASNLARKLNQGYEYQDVECETRLDTPARGSAQIVRLDTKEIVSTRNMTLEESQRGLPFEKARSASA